MKRLSLCTLLLLSPLAFAQESYWVANRFSRDLHAINPGGAVVKHISLSANGLDLDKVFVAPNGTLWVVNFITPTFTLVDPATGAFTNFTDPLGSPDSIAFDTAGHAWIAGGTGVVECDATANQVATYPLPAGTPLGITIDSSGNKWIAHRVGPPGSISRIDPSGAITNHPLAPGSTILPTQVYADFRGLLTPSHIWVLGDNGGDLVEFDSSGAVLNTYHLNASGNFTGLTTDVAGRVYLGDFRNGNLLQVDPANGNILNTFVNPPNVLGLATDGFDRIWASTRVTFSGPQPSEVRRIDGTGGNEVPAVVGLGLESSLSTRFQYALVVDPLGDLDGDGVPNAVELQAGTSPFDGCSTNITSLNTTGTTHIGNTPSIDVLTAASNVTFLAFSQGTVAPGSGITLPGIGCEALLDLTTVFPGTVTILGSTSLPAPIPNNPLFAGFTLYLQGVTLGATSQFTNVSCIQIWM